VAAPSAAFHVTAGSYDTDRLIQVLSELRRVLGGEKATLVWDGLPAHPSTAMRAWIRTQRSWLVVERLPASAPERTRLRAWVQPQGRGAGQPHRPDPGRGDRPGPPGGIQRIREPPQLAFSFLRHPGLSVS
jgi:hypothetical protein